MFSIHSTELLLILIVALIVIGPERLPSAVKTAGLWIGRFRRSFYKVKAEIERELNADEIRRQLHNESVLAEIDQAKSELENAAKNTEESVNKIVNSGDFDPGASAATSDQQTDEKPLTEELNEAGQAVQEVAEEVKETVYGGGRNPKLAQPDDPDASAAETEAQDRQG